MSSTTTLRIDPEVKEQSKRIFDELGISLTAAVNTFLKAVIRERGIPFNLTVDSPKQNPDIRAVAPQGNNTIKPSKSVSKNEYLNTAGKRKNDEFYTQLSDIEAEMSHYKNSFIGKTILCNCDDPFTSNFFRFFVIHFNELGLKKLVSTSFSGRTNQLDNSPQKTQAATRIANAQAYKAVITNVPQPCLISTTSTIDLDLLLNFPGNKLTQLKENGDFRSTECSLLLKEADIVVTNPPFSLFRDFITMLTNYGKKFIILGNVNAATYKEVFPLIKNNKIWFGPSIHSGDRKFYVPDTYPLNAAGCGIDDTGHRFIRVRGVRWFTNVDTPERHKPIELTEKYNSNKYHFFDNYNAINISKTKDIPRGYTGIMGVPITFLDKYCPDQFEILMLANGNSKTNTDKETLKRVGYKKADDDRGGVGLMNGKKTYARILIKTKRNYNL